MRKRLSDFTIRVNLEGWYIRGFRTAHQGDEFQGEMIHSKMIESLKNNETFVLDGTSVVNVCILRGGTLEELIEAYENKDEVEKVVERKAIEKVEEVKEDIKIEEKSKSKFSLDDDEEEPIIKRKIKKSR